MPNFDPDSTRNQDVFLFGPFRLVPAERLLEKAGVPVPLGGRALDLLTVLLERAGDVVSKRDLIDRVWRDVTVNEGSLRFHVGVLRKALGDGEAVARYVSNVPGRGYCFVEPVSRRAAPRRVDETLSSHQRHNLPNRLARMVGRDETVDTIATRLLGERFITIVGPGGIGKTTVATSVAHALLHEFGGQIRFVDLGTINNPQLVVSAVSSALNLSVSSENPLAALIGSLRDKRILLVFDSCEHVIEATAALGERMFIEAPQVHILATSREALRVEGEQVHRLFPLDYPPDDASLTVAEALEFPAIQLFAERVAASAYRSELSDEDAPAIAEICRKLDGIALAIELAAGRVAVYGVRGTAALLDDRFQLIWQGRRTAPPRHQTLNATFEWSYNLLDESERVILSRLSVLVGKFTLEAAQSIAAGDQIDRSQVAEGVSGLVEKSIISTYVEGDDVRYRLLDMTRAYAMGKLIQSKELQAISRRHALFYSEALQRRDGKKAESKAQEMASYGEYLANVRAALEWSFSEGGDKAVGVALAAAAGSLLMVAMSLLTECSHWMARAIAWLDDTARGTSQELELQAFLGLSLLFSTGGTQDARVAFARGLEIAEALDDPWQQLRMINCYHAFMSWTGNWPGALALAQRSASLGEQMADSRAAAMGYSLLALDFHFMGDQAQARIHNEAALANVAPEQRLKLSNLDFSTRPSDLSNLARVEWIQGNALQARALSREAIEAAENRISPLNLCTLLFLVIPIFVSIADYPGAEELIYRLITVADARQLPGFPSLAMGLKGALHVSRGEADVGVGLLRGCLDMPPAVRHETPTMMLACTLADGFAKTGKLNAALATVDDVIEQTERNGGMFGLAEMLRIKADILASMPKPEPFLSEQLLLRSLNIAQSQSALFWQLRTANSLAKLWSSQDRIGEARDILSPVYGRFDQRFETLDLKVARALLDAMH